MKWLAKIVLILGIGFANHLFCGDEYDKDLARQLVVRSDLSGYDLQALRDFVQKAENLDQKAFNENQAHEKDSGLVKDLIARFSLSRSDIQILRRFVQWMQNSTHDQAIEELYTRILKWQKQQEYQKMGLVWTIYDHKLGQFVPEEMIKLDAPVEQAVITWFELWEKEQHLKQRLANLIGDRPSKNLEPALIPRRSFLPFEVDYTKQIEDLELRLKAVKNKEMTDSDVFVPVTIGPDGVSGGIYESSYIDDLVVIEGFLRDMGWNYKDLIKLDLVAKKAKFLIKSSEGISYDSDEVRDQNVEDVLINSSIVSPIFGDLDENNLVVVEQLLFKLAGKTYQELSQAMNFEQKTQALRENLKKGG